LKRLITADPKKRLGGEHGASDIKEHKWFKLKTNFALIRNEKPPLIPNLAHPLDTSNFREIADNPDDDKDTPLQDQDIEPSSPFAPFTSFVTKNSKK